MYEGEVTELTPEEAPSQTGGYGKVISHVVIGLKSVKGTKQLKLDPTIYDRYSQASLFQHPSPLESPQVAPRAMILQGIEGNGSTPMCTVAEHRAHISLACE